MSARRLGTYDENIYIFFNRVESMECILHQCLCHDKADLSDIVLRDKVRNAVVCMMPGIVSTAAFACRNLLDNHRIAQVSCTWRT